ncbi:ribonuclease R [Parabacteroides sp.]
MKRRYILQHVIIFIFKSSPHKLFSYKQISKCIGIVDPVRKLQVVEILYDLADENYIVEVNCGHYRYNNKGSTLVGCFAGRRTGNNLFVPDDGSPPIAVSRLNSLHALDGDRVRVKLLTKRTGPAPEAEVIAILERKEHTVTGRLQVTDKHAFLITESKNSYINVFIGNHLLKGGKKGDKALVRILSWAESEKCPSGEVIEILGKAGDHVAEMRALLIEHGLPYKYPDHLEKAVQRIATAIPEKEIARRKDFRHIRTFTVDPADAKDFDDALSARRLDNGNWEVGVHIADVGYYVKPNTGIDKEAERRAMSVYLVGHTVPMLPERLCNRLCSLCPGEDRLCFSVIFELDADGHVRNFDICRTVIKSNYRFTYQEVQQILETGKGKYKEEIRILDRLAKKLREKRFKNGAIAFNRGSVKFCMDPEYKPLQVYVEELNDANKLIEEFMLLTNRTVAQAVSNMQAPGKGKTFIYRIHAAPVIDRQEKLVALARRFGYKLDTGNGRNGFSRSLNLFLGSITDKAQKSQIDLLVIRLMSKAKYTTDNSGHFGLAFHDYTHFTSPIRRYPDLLVHRLLALYLDRDTNTQRSKYEKLCQHCSAMELSVKAAERDSVRYKQAEFMQGKEGRVFTGIISDVSSWGLLVELDKIRCEGQIPVHRLGNEYFDWNEKNFTLTGRRTKQRFRLGDPVNVKLVHVCPVQKEIEFSLVESCQA